MIDLSLVLAFYTVFQEKHRPLASLDIFNNSVKNQSILIIFDAQHPEENLPHINCCYNTLWNVKLIFKNI